jgi:transcriptional regulator with XRE-family HTH domain
VADERLGERLRRLREAHGMTRAELAAACIKLGWRTDRREIARYEESDYYPRLPTFAALARVLGVSMDVLWYGEEEAEAHAWQHIAAGFGDVLICGPDCDGTQH